MLKSLVRKLNPKAGSMSEFFLVCGVVGTIVAIVLWAIRGSLSTVTQNITSQLKATSSYEIVLAIVIIGCVALFLFGLVSFVNSLSKKVR